MPQAIEGGYHASATDEPVILRCEVRSELGPDRVMNGCAERLRSDQLRLNDQTSTRTPSRKERTSAEVPQNLLGQHARFSRAALL
jgi:hypothetical protein